ncbi:MAG: hypothetical protein MMC33_003441 [Icmadophila ericetorum]|nr:hypothetical protein [Icmadophila ericetorum]
MPTRGKRILEDFDPNKSDPEDSDYDASTARPSRPKPSKPQRSRTTRKKARSGYAGDGSEDVSDEEVTEESSDEGSAPEEPEPEIDARTGRPIRRAKKNRPTYEESDEDEKESDESDVALPATKRQRSGKSLVVKLNVPPKQTTTRTTRARSGSMSTKRPPTASEARGTRRSSRIAHDETETIVALTDSGRHADIIRQGTRSPDEFILRATKGGDKASRKTPSSPILEQEEDSSARTKDEPMEDTNINDPAISDAQEASHMSIDPEIAASREEIITDADGEDEDEEPKQTSKTKRGIDELDNDEDEEPAVVPDSGEDEDYGHKSGPARKRRRLVQRRDEKQDEKLSSKPPNQKDNLAPGRGLRSRSTRQTRSHRSKRDDESSDFEPGPEEGAEENVSDSEESISSPRKPSQPNEDDSDNKARRAGRPGKLREASRRNSDEHDSEVADELAEELEDLRSSRPRRKQPEILFEEARPQTRKRKPVDYRILRPDLAIPLEDDGPPTATTPSKRARLGAAGARNWSLFSTRGPFGGTGAIGEPEKVAAAGGADSDSSDDERMQQPRIPGVGGTVGMTPTSVVPTGFGLFPGQAFNDPAQGPSGTPANHGKIKDKALLTDADPLGVDQNVTFDAVGGLGDHIDKLKEMVMLPLLYPEVFQQFHITPPRGVLFHGPPGTGKTLLARALSNSVSSSGKKVTFYMRKGADSLSKWVGEAEKGLRLLFEEARKTQPSIIFFDEIDGLAPVRSSKQEQIHSSIVATLLALMDGMDGRGQVIVIGATNRPDTVDPALRRPGRFDREFYFPLPSLEARKSILNIHTKGWKPPVSDALKHELAQLTKGYGGADLRALCTEATLNAVQRKYPQIYKSNEKLQIKPETIQVAPKDFMISIKRIIPSSQRSATSGASPLPKSVEPLLRAPLKEIQNLIGELLPRKKSLTALEEAEFEDAEQDGSFEAERMQQEFERSQIFRPRLLVHGLAGMGQQYLTAAVLNSLEGVHVQSFDLSSLFSDSSISPEATIVRLFTEVRRHRPSVIHIPNVDAWYQTLTDSARSTLLGLLRSLAPTEPVMVFGTLESNEPTDLQMIKDLFGYSKSNQYLLGKPRREYRNEYYSPLKHWINMSPTDFPEPAERKKRVLEKLAPVPPEPPKPPPPQSAAEIKAQKKKDHFTLNMLKVKLQPIMDQIKLKNKRFRTPAIEPEKIAYIYEEEDPTVVTTDLPQEQRQAARFRPYEKGFDANGEPGLVEQATGKFIYNMEIVTIEERLSNGYYKRPKDFLADIKKLTKDAKAINNQERLLKAKDLQATVEVDIATFFDHNEPAFTAECEAVYLREKQREKEQVEKAKRQAEAEGRALVPFQTNVPPDNNDESTQQSSGPIVLGPPVTNGVRHFPLPVTPIHTQPHVSQPSSGLTNGVSGGLSDLSHQTNGNSVPSRGEHAQESSGHQSTARETQGSSFGPSAQTRPPETHTGPPSLQQRLSYPGSLSQQSAFTPLAEGSNPHMYANDASSTSSDKRVSGSSGLINTQSTHSKRAGDGPDLSIHHPHIDDSTYKDLPDTQELMNSQSQGTHHASNLESPRHSQNLHSSPPQPPVPPFPRPHASGIHSLLNASPPITTVAKIPDHPPHLVDLHVTERFLDELLAKTSACTVEQSEQVYSALMSEIWRTRGEWNRVKVAEGMRELLDATLADMQDCQDFGPGSMEYREPVEHAPGPSGYLAGGIGSDSAYGPSN